MNRNAFLAAALTAVLALTGCAVPSDQKAPENPAQTAQPAPAGADTGTATPPVSPDPHFLTTSPAGVLQHKTYAPGQSVPQDTGGLYLMETATGKVEAWTLAGAAGAQSAAQAGFSASDDGQYVIARAADLGWLASGDKVFQWDRSQYELVSASAAALIFEQVEPAQPGAPQWYRAGWGPGGRFAWTGRFTVLGPDLRPQTTFTLPTAGETNNRPALFSPDGKQLALVAGGKLYLADLTNGATQQVDTDGVGGVTLSPLNDGLTFIARALAGPAGNVPSSRYTWDGRKLSPLPAGAPSPDGSLTAATVWVDGFTPATVVTDTASGQPVMRILGGDLCRGVALPGSPWSSDSASLLVGTRQGERQVSVTGTLSKPAAIQGEGFHDTLPSPAARDLVAHRLSQQDGSYHLQVADERGKVRAEAAFGSVGAGLWHAPLPLWHPTGKYLQVSLYHKGASGGPRGDYAIPLPAKVQRAPFPSDLVLQVQDTGDCLPLRAEASEKSSRLACLKDGTRLTVTPAEQLKYSSWLTAQTWGDGGQWAHVRTPEGQEGWVTLEGHSLAWAE